MAPIVAGHCGNGRCEPLETPDTCPQDCGNAGSVVIWDFNNHCSMPGGLQLRIFDKTADTATPLVALAPGQSTEQQLTCTPGDQLCFGARSVADTNKFWGVDIDNSQACTGCCLTCKPQQITQSLTCNH